MRRLAVLSLHTSPLAQPGTGDGGGMNVYVRELASALARSGVSCEVFTRAWDPALPPVVRVEPGFQVHHVPAGPVAPMAKEALPGVVAEFTEGVLARMAGEPGPGADGDREGPFEAIHANYWLSGLAGHTLKHELDLPLVSTFHTLDRVKAEAGPEEVEADLVHRRAEAEAAIIRCSDAVLASCTVEADQIAELYPADPARIAVVAPGVDHAYFGPGHRPQARRALGLPGDGPLLLMVGRIQPLKGADVAVRTLAELRRRGLPYRLVVVGGPSGPRGDDAYKQLVLLAEELEVADRLTMVDPQPHELLSTYYRAADVCLVPSRSESFGLVALEAAACGTPVVASAVGGLTTLVDHGRTGFLVDGADPAVYAAQVRRIVEEPLLAERLSTAAVLRARRYTWREAAERLQAVHDRLVAGRLVEC
ncbi:MAG TPA: glycosyltransferase [Acidimicrobiales bacterium]|jgi:D-inositol-3-phosphate glycosyltransferase|nr:glycosyltransferase [Acidimicrobiales bacterium]